MLRFWPSIYTLNVKKQNIFDRSACECQIVPVGALIEVMFLAGPCMAKLGPFHQLTL